MIRFLAQAGIESYSGSPPLEDSLYSEFARRLEDDASDTVVFQILVEEWTFLQSQSWIASRIRRPFSAFLRAGAVAIDWGGKTLDEVVVRTLKIPQQKCPLPNTSPVIESSV